MRPASKPLAALAMTLAIIAGGCSKDSSSPDTGTACDQKIAAAEASLENALYNELNSDPEQPSDLNFQATYQLYQEALQCGATNGDANFGAAVLGLLSLSSDPEVNAAFDEWKTYLSSRTPFEAPLTRGAPLGVPISFRSGPAALRLPFDVLSFSVAALAKPSRIAEDPQLSRAQTILETRALPRLTQALARLQLVAANPNYRFIVTPRMQGDTDADPVEIDQTDILALRAAVGLLASACHVAVAYNVNFASYDSVGLMQALTPGSGWMALRTQGASHMASAGLELSGAIGDLDAAISSLLAESDPQDDDVIKTGPDGVSAAEAESIQVHLDDVRAGMAAGYTRTDDWDGNSGTPDVPLTIRLGQLFTNPVNDWKALFPTYTPSVVRKTTDTYTNYVSTLDPHELDAPGAGFYYASASLNVQQHQVVSQSFYGDSLLLQSLNSTLQDAYVNTQAIPTWEGDLYAEASFGGPLVAGYNLINVSIFTFTRIATSKAYKPVITWTADTFDQWIWPDPTMHGLLPGMGSSSQLLSTFGITAQQWTKEVELSVASNGAPIATRRHLH